MRMCVWQVIVVVLAREKVQCMMVDTTDPVVV